MPVSKDDMKLIEATTMPSSFSTTSVGGAIGSTPISSASVGQVHFTMASLPSGDAVQYSKFFDKNDHATDTVNNYGVWIANALDTLGGAATISFASSSASDDSSKKIQVVGENGSGQPQTEYVTMNGTSTVTTSLTYTARWRLIVRDSVTNAVTPLAGDLTATHSASEVGVIPAGLYSGTAEIDIGLAATIDDSVTIADASTAPAGISFSRPRTQASRLLVDGGTGTLEAQEAQGIWSRLTLPEGIGPSPDVQVDIRGYGEPVGA